MNSFKINNLSKNSLKSFKSVENNVKNAFLIENKPLELNFLKINKPQAFNEDEILSFKNLDEEVKNQNQTLEAETEILVNQKNSALSNFDIFYATSLCKKIDKINEKINENNKKILKAESEINERELNFTSQNLPNINQTEFSENNKIQEILKLFSHLSKEEIIKELSSNQLYKLALGADFDRLLAAVRE